MATQDMTPQDHLKCQSEPTEISYLSNENRSDLHFRLDTDEPKVSFSKSLIRLTDGSDLT